MKKSPSDFLAKKMAGWVGPFDPHDTVDGKNPAPVDR